MKKTGKSRVPKLGFRRGRILVVEKKKCGLGNVFSHTEMRPLLFCVSDTPKTALIYLKNGPNCCVRFYFSGRYMIKSDFRLMVLGICGSHPRTILKPI